MKIPLVFAAALLGAGVIVFYVAVPGEVQRVGETSSASAPAALAERRRIEPEVKKVVLLPGTNAERMDERKADTQGKQGKRVEQELILTPVAIDSVREEKHREMLAIYAREGLDAALQFLRQNFARDHQQEALRHLIAEVGKKDLIGFSRLYSLMEKGPDRAYGVNFVVHEWLGRDPGKLLSFVDQQTSGPLQSELRKAIIGTYAVMKNWEQGEKVLNQISGPARMQTISDFAFQYGTVDAGKGLAWAAKLPSPAEAHAAQRSIVFGMKMSGNIEGLVESIGKLPPESRGSAKELLGQNAMEAGLSIEEIIAKQAGQEGSVAPILSGAMSKASREGLDEIYALKEQVSDPLERSLLAGKYAQRLFDFNRQEALTWAANQTGKECEAAVRAAVWRWQNVDALYISTWTQTLPRGQAQDVAFEALANHFRSKDPDLAVKLAGDISDEARRKRVLRSMGVVSPKR